MSWRLVLRTEWVRSLAWVMAVAAVVVMMIGGRHVAASPFASDAVAHLIAGGLGGLLLLAGSVAALLSADLRDEAAKLRTLEGLLGQPDGALPTHRRIHATVILLSVAGIAVGVVGWARAAGTGDLDRALGGFALAALGVLIAGAGAALHTLIDRRSVRIRVGAFLAASTDRPAATAHVVDGGRYTVDGLSRYHRRSCKALASAQGPVRRIDAVTVLEPCLICNGED